MVAPKSTYEQMRKRRLEENKKRMEELNLKNLSQALKNTSPKPSPMKQMKPRTPRQRVDLTAVRRSSRVADKPKPNYKDIPLEPLERPRRSHSRRNLWDRVYASDEERAYAIERAEQLESTLESDYPSFVKPMLQSHVTGGFWLGLPVQFCKKHLPDEDKMISLVDETGEEFPTKYLAEKTGLSGGWRGFSVDHNLVDGDALVFQLVTPAEFKVYIIRAYESEDNEDGEPGEDDKEPEPDVKPDVQVLDRSAKRIRARK
ncbi:PREDICTED: B3 domain-containing protein At3g19184 isoform X2 [Theobroma cacao]|uniref:B3 domain-containing protein At3g19184 isoform X2 n=1 Tax=Theobroma cacao TaxID=3641 RepID=A0AB32VE42_THECC|nr:PREDICTED: B3 domain-containing protein At3g19184 isoform X2 [Theobroma cacao]